jgi:hypothetical protein
VLQGQPVIDAGTYAAAVFMVVATMMATPPLLLSSLRRAPRKGGHLNGRDLESPALARAPGGMTTHPPSSSSPSICSRLSTEKARVSRAMLPTTAFSTRLFT